MSSSYETLSAYLEGDLSQAEAAEIEARLATDPALRASLSELEQLGALLREHGPTAAPPSLYGAVMEAVAKESAPQGWWAWLRRPLGVPVEGWAVGLAVAAVLLLMVKPAGEALAPADGFELPYSSRTAPAQQAAQTEEVAQRPSSAKDAPPSGSSAGERGTASTGTTANTAAPPMAAEAKGSSPKDGSRRLAKKTRLEPVKEPSTKGRSKLNSTPSKQALQLTPGSSKQPEASAATKGGWANSPRAYQVYTDDPDYLRKLQRLAGKHQGRITDGQRPLDISTLNPASAAVYVELPASELPRFHRDLSRIGGEVREQAGEDRLYPRDRVNVRIEVHRAPQMQMQKPARRALDEGADVGEAL